MPNSSTKFNDPWQLPYIGNAYNLSYNDRIYFKHHDDDGERKVWLEQDCTYLIGLLRGIRGAGAIRFIVNPHGAIITKVEYTDGSWRPHFVSMLDFDNWFSKDPLYFQLCLHSSNILETPPPVWFVRASIGYP